MNILYTPKANIAAAIACMLCAVSVNAASPPEDFSTFFQHFAADGVFRATRLAVPVQVLLDPTEVPRKEYQWSREQLQQEMVAPLPRAKLGGLTEQVTHLSAAEIEVTQMEPEADTYRYSYYFREINGQWFLYRYEDTSL